MDLVESEGEKKWSRRPAENGGTGEQGILRVEAGRVLWWWIVHGVLGWREMVLLLTNLILWLPTCDCRIQHT